MSLQADPLVLDRSRVGKTDGAARENAVCHTNGPEPGLGHEDTWQILDISDVDAVAEARVSIARISAEDSRATLEHDFDWVMANYAAISGALNIWLCNQGNSIVGYAPVTITPAKLRPSIGDLTVASWHIERHTVVGCPLYADSVSDQKQRLTLSLLTLIRRTLPPSGVLFLLGARADSALFDVLGDRSLRPPFFIAGHGPLYNRRLVRLPDTFDAYLAGLSKKTRMNVRRYKRKINKVATKQIRLSRYVTVEDVEPFLDVAVPLSRKTYQWKKLGLGLHDREDIARRFTIAAEQSRMLSYVLFHGDEPIAFQVGYCFRDTYFTHDTGYDPAWAKYWVGNQLDLLIIRDMIERYPGIQWVDFLYGDTFNKKRLSNAARVEQNFYLFPRSCRGTAVFASLKSANLLSETAGRMLSRFGIKEKLRKLLWR